MASSWWDENRGKNSFILYVDEKEVVELLSDEQAGVLFKGIFRYLAKEEIPEMDGMTRVAFASIKKHLDANAAKYEEVCRRRREAGKKGGRPKKEENQEVAEKPNGFHENQMVYGKPNGFFGKHTETDTGTETGTETDTKTDTGTETGTETDTKTDTEPPMGVFSSSSSSMPPPPPPADYRSLVSIPLPGGKEWKPSEEMYQQMVSSYPALSIPEQFFRMRAWCMGNGPSGCFSGASVESFAWRWLSKEAQATAREDAKAASREEHKKEKKRDSWEEWQELARRVENGEFG